MSFFIENFFLIYFFFKNNSFNYYFSTLLESTSNYSITFDNFLDFNNNLLNLPLPASERMNSLVILYLEVSYCLFFFIVSFFLLETILVHSSNEWNTLFLNKLNSHDDSFLAFNVYPVHFTPEEEHFIDIFVIFIPTLIILQIIVPTLGYLYNEEILYYDTYIYFYVNDSFSKKELCLTFRSKKKETFNIQKRNYMHKRSKILKNFDKISDNTELKFKLDLEKNSPTELINSFFNSKQGTNLVDVLSNNLIDIKKNISNVKKESQIVKKMYPFFKKWKNYDVLFNNVFKLNKKNLDYDNSCSNHYIFLKYCKNYVAKTKETVYQFKVYKITSAKKSNFAMQFKTFHNIKNSNKILIDLKFVDVLQNTDTTNGKILYSMLYNSVLCIDPIDFNKYEIIIPNNQFNLNIESCNIYINYYILNNIYHFLDNKGFNSYSKEMLLKNNYIKEHDTNKKYILHNLNKKKLNNVSSSEIKKNNIIIDDIIITKHFINYIYYESTISRLTLFDNESDYYIKYIKECEELHKYLNKKNFIEITVDNDFISIKDKYLSFFLKNHKNTFKAVTISGEKITFKYSSTNNKFKSEAGFSYKEEAGENLVLNSDAVNKSELNKCYELSNTTYFNNDEDETYFDSDDHLDDYDNFHNDDEDYDNSNNDNSNND